MTPTYRVGTVEDARAVYEVFAHTIADLERRMGTPETDNAWTDRAVVAERWERRRPLLEHLARTAERFWVAERDRQVIGYARATLRDGVRELTEFFVLPGHQAGGVGRELLARTFPPDGARHRTVIATADVRALARYLKAGVYARSPVYYVSRAPQPVAIETDLTVDPVATVPEAIAAMRAIDRAILGHARDADHEFLLQSREAYLYRRADRIVGYGYFGRDTGPIALLDPSDFPAVLARGETAAAARNEATFGVNVPLINRAAVDHVMGRGFRLDAFPMLFMSDGAVATFERYVLTNPPFFV